jgi:cellulose synthase/poly-beta-1,6-N-acetylglucosamine synthase-like glycosyltransferase
VPESVPASNSTRKPARVSIALCTFNGARFLEEQLDSLLAQTYREIEIIVSDDASSDATVAILERYAQRDPRIVIGVNDSNLGFAQNFEHALTRCNGAFIAPCDQDDVWLPDKIAVLVESIGTHSLAYCDSKLVDEFGHPTGPRMSDIVPMLSTADQSPFAFGNCVSGHAMLFRRELVDHALPVPDGFFYDWWIAAVAASTGGIVFVDESLVLYRQHGRNITDARLGEMLQEAGIDSVRRAGAEDTAEAPSSVNTKLRSRLRYLRETRQRLIALSKLPGRHQAFVGKLLSLWISRERQWLSPALGRFMHLHRGRLLALTKLSEKKQRRYCRRFFYGMRLRP